MDCLSLILRLASSEVEEEWEEVSLIGAVSVEASCWSRLGCVEVESDILRGGKKGRRRRRKGGGDGREYILNYLG